MQSSPLHKYKWGCTPSPTYINDHSVSSSSTSRQRGVSAIDHVVSLLYSVLTDDLHYECRWKTTCYRYTVLGTTCFVRKTFLDLSVWKGFLSVILQFNLFFCSMPDYATEQQYRTIRIVAAHTKLARISAGQ